MTLPSMTIWGNHQLHPIPRSVPRQGQRQERHRSGRSGLVQRDLHPDRATTRRRAIIAARGASSAASAANAAIDHMRTWALGTTGDDWVSMACVQRWQLRHRQGPDLFLPRALQKRRLGNRAGPAHRRFQPGKNEGDGKGTGRGTRRGQTPAALIDRADRNGSSAQRYSRFCFEDSTHCYFTHKETDHETQSFGSLARWFERWQGHHFHRQRRALQYAVFLQHAF